MKFDILKSMNGALTDLSLAVDQYKPEIYMYAGIGGVIAATILACRASTKLNGIAEKHKAAMEANREERAKFEEKKPTLSAEDAKTLENKLNQDVTATYGRTVLEVGKAFVLPALLGAASIYSIVHSHDILRDRNAELASLTAATSAAFKEYRSRVADKYGEEVDKEIRHGVSEMTIGKEVENEETGEMEWKEGKLRTSETENKEKHEKHDTRYFFDARSRLYDKRTPKMNVRILKAQERYANDLIQARARSSGTGRGVVFLAEVLRELFPGDNEIGMQPWEQTMCWIYDEKHPVGDNYISFGIFYSDDAATQLFLEGIEPVVLLDFNCDGDIHQFM